MGADPPRAEPGQPVADNVFLEIVDSFRRNIESVHQLAEFDHLVLQFAIDALDRVEQRATNASVSNYRLMVTQTLRHLRDIRQHDSLRPQYQQMFNQCVVLLVSYFGSAISDIFERCVGERVKRRGCDRLMKEELRVTVRELSEIGSQLHEYLGEILIRTREISFQDMQSIARAFGSYCGHSPEKDENVNNIIAAQACRHVIVHSGAVITERCVRQLSTAVPRTLKPTLDVGHTVQFSVDEIKTLSASMIQYVDTLVVALVRSLEIDTDRDGPSSPS